MATRTRAFRSRHRPASTAMPSTCTVNAPSNWMRSFPWEDFTIHHYHDRRDLVVLIRRSSGRRRASLADEVVTAAGAVVEDCAADAGSGKKAVGQEDREMLADRPRGQVEVRQGGLRRGLGQRNQQTSTRLPADDAAEPAID
jgi:hypothetical protein